MAAAKVTFDTVRSICLAMPDVEDGTTFGSPAFKVKGKMFACLATHKSAEAGSLVVRVSVAEREQMIAAEPDVYYLKEHYVPYPVVLVRIARIHPDALRDLLQMGVRFVSSKTKRK